MKQILFVATTNLQERNGGALATLAYYNAFRHLYGDMVDLALPAEFCQGNFAAAIPVPKRNRLSTYLTFFKGSFHRYKDFLYNHLQRNSERYGLAVINGGFYAGDMVGMFHSFGIKVIVIHHNYEPEYHLDNRTLPTFGGLTSYFVAKNERMAYMRADLNAFLTQSDIALHRQHYGNGKKRPFLLGVFEPIHQDVFPGGQGNLNDKGAHGIVITGSMNSVQTLRGIMDFKANYFPIVRKILPNWKIIIAGRDPHPNILKFAEENADSVQVIPNPENMDVVIAKGSIFLCPTHVGGGLKLRLMDGLRGGLAVLTHEVSARGYDMFFNQPFFQVYRDKESFERGLSALAKAIDGGGQNRPDICAIYRSKFSFEAGCKRVEELCNVIGLSNISELRL